MIFHLSTTSQKKLIGVHPDLIKVVERAITLTEVDFAVIQGLRTQADQDALYALGRTAPGPIVTWTLHSNHISGHAVDLGAFVNGEYVQGINDKELGYYDSVAKAMLQAAADLNIKITWGVGGMVGPRPKEDFDHFELNRQFYPDMEPSA